MQVDLERYETRPEVPLKPWGAAFKILTFLQVAEASRPSNLASLHLVGSEDA